MGLSQAATEISKLVGGGETLPEVQADFTYEEHVKMGKLPTSLALSQARIRHRPILGIDPY